MKTFPNLREIIIGSVIFMCLDRVIKIISQRVIQKGTSEETSLRIEMMILVIVFLIAWKIF